MSKLRAAAVFGALVAAVPSACIPLATMHMQRQSIPKKLHTGWFYAEASCDYSSIFSYQGAFAFSLQQGTIDKIKSTGLSFFDNIRDPANDAASRYFVNHFWKETPVSSEAFERGVGSNLGCGTHSWLWPNGIHTALRRPGSFYTDTGQRGIFVIPSLGIVVASASDR